MARQIVFAASETTSSSHDFPANWPKAVDVSKALRAKLKENHRMHFGGKTSNDEKTGEDLKIKQHLMYTHEQVNDDPLGLEYYNMTYDATYHSPEDGHLALHSEKNASPGGKLTAHIGINIKSYLPHIRLSLLHQEQRVSNKTSSDGPAYQDLLSNQKKATDQGQSIMQPHSVAVNIHSQALKSIRAFSIADKDLPSLAPVELAVYQDLPSAFCTDFVDPITDQDDHAVPIFGELKFDMDRAATESVHLNPPAFAIPWITQLKKGIVRFIIKGHSSTVLQLKTMVLLLECQKAVGNPLDIFWDKGDAAKKIFKEENLREVPSSSLTREPIEYSRKLGFHDDDDFSTVIGHSVIRHLETARKQQDQYEKTNQELYLFDVPGTVDQSTYMGFLSLRSELHVDVDEGTALEIEFLPSQNTHLPESEFSPSAPEGGSESNQDHKTDAIDWSAVGKEHTAEATEEIDRDEQPPDRFEPNPKWNAQVTMNAGFAPDNFVTVKVVRPYHQDIQEFDKTSKFQVLSLKNVDADKVSRYIKSKRGQPVRARLKTSLSTLKQNLSALNDLYQPSKKRGLVEFNVIMKDALAFKDINKFGERDVYQDIRDEFPEPERVMSLNLQQEKCIRALKHALAGMALVHGPPGTGKTYLIGELTKPFLCHSKAHLVLMMAPSNQATNAIAATMIKVLSELKASKQLSPDAYILRIHSRATESQIQLRGSKLYDLEEIRPRVQAMPSGLSKLEQIIFETYRQSKKSTFLSIQDSRLVHYELSIGYRMLAVAGLIEGEVSPDPAKWAEFRKLLEQRCDPSIEMNKAAENAYKEWSEKLFQDVCQNAHAIIATTFQAGHTTLLEAIEPHVKAIFVDEACRERPDNLIPVLRGRFANIRGFIQMEVSFFSQLYMQGFPFTFLDLQSRMIHQISEIACQFTYGERLRNSVFVDVTKRPFAEIFRKAIHKITNKAYSKVNAIIIDVEDKDASRTRGLARNGSRYNEYYVERVITLLKIILSDSAQLLRKKKIARMPSVTILTGYSAQKAKYLARVQAMKIAGFDVSSVECETFDGAQGKECDFALVDLLITSTVGFQADPRRLNVATTRARDGLMLMTSTQAIDRSDGRGKHQLKKLVQAFRYQFDVEVRGH